ncbi:hypothetical protein IWX47DRAFT_303748 [Phyllosticta citricarpa]
MSSIQIDYPGRAANAHAASRPRIDLLFEIFFLRSSTEVVNFQVPKQLTQSRLTMTVSRPKLRAAKRLGTRVPWTSSRQTYPISDSVLQGTVGPCISKIFTRPVHQGIQSSKQSRRWHRACLPLGRGRANKAVVIGLFVGQRWMGESTKKFRPRWTFSFVSFPTLRSVLAVQGSLRRQPSPTKVERGVAFQEGISGLGRPSIKPLTAWRQGCSRLGPRRKSEVETRVQRVRNFSFSVAEREVIRGQTPAAAMVSMTCAPSRSVHFVKGAGLHRRGASVQQSLCSPIADTPSPPTAGEPFTTTDDDDDEEEESWMEYAGIGPTVCWPYAGLAWAYTTCDDGLHGQDKVMARRGKRTCVWICVYVCSYRQRERERERERERRH